MRKITIHYHESEISSMVAYFVKGFEPRDGGMVSSHEYFIDPAKGKVIIKLYIDEVDRGAVLAAHQERA